MGGSPESQKLLLMYVTDVIGEVDILRIYAFWLEFRVGAKSPSDAGGSPQAARVPPHYYIYFLYQQKSYSISDFGCYCFLNGMG